MKQFRLLLGLDFEEKRSLSEIQDELFTLAESGEGEDRAMDASCERLDNVMAHLDGAKEIRCEFIEKSPRCRHLLSRI